MQEIVAKLRPEFGKKPKFGSGRSFGRSLRPNIRFAEASVVHYNFSLAFVIFSSKVKRLRRQALGIKTNKILRTPNG